MCCGKLGFFFIFFFLLASRQTFQRHLRKAGWCAWLAMCFWDVKSNFLLLPFTLWFWSFMEVCRTEELACNWGGLLQTPISVGVAPVLGIMSIKTGFVFIHSIFLRQKHACHLSFCYYWFISVLADFLFFSFPDNSRVDYNIAKLCVIAYTLFIRSKQIWVNWTLFCIMGLEW